MSLTTRFPLLQRAGWSRAGSSAGGAGGTNQLYVFILRGGGIILENIANHPTTNKKRHEPKLRGAECGPCGDRTRDLRIKSP